MASTTNFWLTVTLDTHRFCGLITTGMSWQRHYFITSDATAVSAYRS